MESEKATHKMPHAGLNASPAPAQAIHIEL